MTDQPLFPKNRWRKNICAASIGAVLFFFLDQLTKEWIVRNIPLHSIHVVIPDFFNITYVTNPGAAWSILAGKSWLLLSISFAAFLLILIFLKKLVECWPERIYALLAVCSGIAGNCTDRIFRGEVVDFLQFHIGKYYWPSFNVADTCITCGVIIFAASSMFRPEKKESPAAADPK